MSLWDDEDFVTIEVIRSAKGSYRKGKYNAEIECEFPIRASVQPFTPSQLDPQFSNRRTSELIKIYTDTELFETDESIDFRRADLVVYKGRKYEVQRTSEFDETDCSHWKHIAARVSK